LELNPIDKEDAVKKLVNRDRKDANEKVEKIYPETLRRMRVTFVSRHLDGLLAERAHFLEQLLVLRRDLGPLPSEDLVLLHMFIGARRAILALLHAWSHGGCAVEQKRGAKDECARCSRRKKNRGRKRAAQRRGRRKK
jgi:hypothetical protein